VIFVLPNNGSTIYIHFLSRCNVAVFLGFGENTNYMHTTALFLTYKLKSYEVKPAYGPEIDVICPCAEQEYEGTCLWK
jgi:hypothetical protein